MKILFLPHHVRHEHASLARSGLRNREKQKKKKKTQDSKNTKIMVETLYGSSFNEVEKMMKERKLQVNGKGF